jgi:ferredoxin
VSEEPPRKKIVLDLDFFGPPEQPKPGRVQFMPGGRTIDLEPGESIFDAAKRNGIFIPTVCGGKGTCGTCRIRFTLPAREPTILERQFIDRSDLASGVRLACRSRPTTDVTVTVLPEPRRFKR